jgi:hypothetical protein
LGRLSLFSFELVQVVVGRTHTERIRILASISTTVCFALREAHSRLRFPRPHSAALVRVRSFRDRTPYLARRPCLPIYHFPFYEDFRLVDLSRSCLAQILSATTLRTARVPNRIEHRLRMRGVGSRKHPEAETCPIQRYGRRLDTRTCSLKSVTFRSLPN